MNTRQRGDFATSQASAGYLQLHGVGSVEVDWLAICAWPRGYVLAEICKRNHDKLCNTVVHAVLLLWRGVAFNTTVLRVLTIW